MSDTPRASSRQRKILIVIVGGVMAAFAASAGLAGLLHVGLIANDGPHALPTASIDPADPAAPAGGLESFVRASTPLRSIHFVPNLGQWDDQTASYAFRSRGMDIV